MKKNIIKVAFVAAIAMMKKRSCLCLLAALTFMSCSNFHYYENVEKIGVNDFIKTENLDGHVLTFDSLVMRPVDMQVIDSLLFVVDLYDEKHIQIYNMKTKKKLGSRIYFGQGPNDMLQPVFVKNSKKSIRLYDMATSYLFQYDVKSFLETEVPVPISKTKLEKKGINNVEVMGDKIYGYSFITDKQMSVFDAQSGEKVFEMVEFPQSNISYSDSERKDAFYMNFTTDEHDRIVVCYCMTDLIRIYNSKGDVLKSIHGPGQFFSYFKEIHDGTVVTSLMDNEKNRDAYFSPINVGDRFFVLYDGEKVNAPGHDSLCEYLYSFTWDGIPDKIYKLSEPISSYTVDVEERKVYGISNKPEYHIVEFSY